MIGKKISHYEILGKLGEGGMGVVYKAKDTKLERIVALKFLPPEMTRDPQAKERFIREARAASALDHGNICNIHEIDETDDGRLFIAMACYEGKTLKQKIEHGEIKTGRAIDIAIQISRGLKRAHEEGIIHRDIKSANIFFTNHKEVKILDFGLAKLSGHAQLTSDTSTLGTVAYMSPEQVRGMEVDQRSDLWSLGIVLYEMLTGVTPFHADYDQAILYSIVNDEPVPLSKSGKKFPPELEYVVEKCLQKNPKDRYQNILEIIKDLEVIQSGQPVRKSGRIKIIRTGSQKTYWISTSLILILAVIILGSNWSSVKKLAGISGLPLKKHLAVLPFTLIGEDQTKKAFCDGLVVTLTSKLGQLEYYQQDLWIVPAAEIRKHEVSTPSEVKNKFKDVRLAVSGSVQFDRDEMRLTMNLIDTEEMRQIESRVKNYQYASLFHLQDDVVTQLVKMLNEEIRPGVEQMLLEGGTQNSEAFDYYLQGRGYLYQYQEEENVDKALELFHKAAKADPDYALAFAGLGEAHWRKYNYDKEIQTVDSARYYCTQALQLNDRLAQVYITLGIVRSGTGQYEEAVQYFQRALDLDPVNADATRELANTYRKLKKDSLAEATYKKAIDLKPAYWANYNSLGVYYYYQGRYEEAATQFKQAVILTPNNIKGFNNLGGMYFFMDNFKEAIEAFEQSIKIADNDVAYCNLGTLYWYEENYARSTEMFERSLEISDKDFRIWGGLAASYAMIPDHEEKMNRAYKKAIALGEKSLLVNPNDYYVLADIGNYHASIGNKDLALAYANKVIKSDPASMDIFFVLCELYETIGNRREALFWMGKAIEGGYSLKLIESLPSLKDLREDDDYKKLIAKIKK